MQPFEANFWSNFSSQEKQIFPLIVCLSNRGNQLEGMIWVIRLF